MSPIELMMAKLADNRARQHWFPHRHHYLHLQLQAEVLLLLVVEVVVEVVEEVVEEVVVAVPSGRAIPSTPRYFLQTALHKIPKKGIKSVR